MDNIDYNKEACHRQACAIQNCIQKNNYNEAKCTALIDALYDCCARFYNDNGLEAKSVTCPRPELLKLKIEQRGRESVDAKILETKLANK
ncbi:Cx9C motif-containing protein 4, mitochondrial [Nadsonia fulvescens var. elongata DSM 6958]|uniref:Cx9C motif-containing protein 4, mitochondrial n=1 Tax=Nadsonia fulvescens var. elongata DSM 6958 TaxID=857566 RepID=A0A1E3PD85_9ASCO|nr:Cx9C motif-containing protein 4, mitochondrial [Nadsonia fulvescens var. elongata DSM 6958]